METIQGRAMVRADLAHAGSNALISTVLGALEKLTTDDITDFAARYLKPDAARCRAGRPRRDAARGARPRRRPAPDDPITAPGAETRTRRFRRSRATRPTCPTTRSCCATTQVPGARAALVRTLPNGLTVIALRRPGLPFVSMLLGFHADPQPGDAPGARSRSARVLRWDLSSRPVELGLLRS